MNMLAQTAPTPPPAAPAPPAPPSPSPAAPSAGGEAPKAAPAAVAPSPPAAPAAPQEAPPTPAAPAAAKDTPPVEAPAAPTPAAPAAPKEAPPVVASPAPAAAPASATGTVSVPAPGGTAPEEGAGSVPSEVVFVIGVFLMGMFLWYFGTESARRKRVIGSFLAVAVAAGCLWFYDSLGIRKGIEIQGGIAMTIKIDPGKDEKGEVRPVTPAAQQEAIKVLQRRLDSLGTQELTISAQGEDRIFLEIPGMGEERRKEIEGLLSKVARLDFSVVHPDRFLVQQVVAGSHVEPGWRALPYVAEADADGKPLPSRGHELVKLRPDMAGKHVTSAHYFYGPEGDSISVSFDSEGAGIMAALTQANVNRQLAIIMDGEVLSAPVINEPFSNGCLITGNFTQESATALASALENPLENPIRIESSNIISPTMGEETVRQGVMAGVAGLTLTLLFIVFYYRFSGLVALVGLTVNGVMIFGAMALFKFTLTLPGIAGIILTIGVAIDANVLIYERLREELQAGKALEGAVKNAYEKAFSAIMDSNLTSLFTSVILFMVATGTVRGFAITLTIGILSSLFSALVVTRVCFGWAVETGFCKKLTSLNMAPKRFFDFFAHSRACLTFSLIAVVASLIAVPLIDPRGVDLKGGDKLEIRSVEGLSVEKIAGILEGADIGRKPIIQSQSPVGAEGEFFSVRSDFGTAPKVIEAIEKGAGVKLTDTTTESIGSAVGNELLRTSAIAMALGLLAILIYVTVRYEFAFAFGALAALIHDLIVTCGFLAITGQEISLITVSALLTIAGYSINDTIVVFDRVREGLATKRGEVKDVMNFSLNATLSRTMLTGLTTLLTVVTMLVFAGSSLSNFALTLLVGILYGTYSSIWVASPIVLWWVKRTGTNLRREVLDTEAARVATGPGTAPAA